MKSLEYYTEKLTALTRKTWDDFDQNDRNEELIAFQCIESHTRRLLELIEASRKEAARNWPECQAYRYRQSIIRAITNDLEGGMFLGTWLQETTNEKIADMCNRFGYCEPLEAAKWLHQGIAPERKPYDGPLKMITTTTNTATA